MLQTVAPIFLVLGVGWLGGRLRLIADAEVDALMRFITYFAVPPLLFLATARMDAAALDWRVLLSFYGPSFFAFTCMILISRRFFGRRPGESVAAGFTCLFGNTLLLGLPIAERAFGSEGVDACIMLISVHAAAMYLVGVVAMETSARDGAGAAAAFGKVWRSLSRNPLILGIAAGFVWNLSRAPFPPLAQDSMALLAKAALPTGLFAIGASLTRYSLSGAALETAVSVAMKMAVHPALAFAMTQALGLSGETCPGRCSDRGDAGGDQRLYLRPHVWPGRGSGRQRPTGRGGAFPGDDPLMAGGGGGVGSVRPPPRWRG